MTQAIDAKLSIYSGYSVKRSTNDAQVSKVKSELRSNDSQEKDETRVDLSIRNLVDFKGLEQARMNRLEDVRKSVKEGTYKPNLDITAAKFLADISSGSKESKT